MAQIWGSKISALTLIHSKLPMCVCSDSLNPRPEHDLGVSLNGTVLIKQYPLCTHSPNLFYCWYKIYPEPYLALPPAPQVSWAPDPVVSRTYLSSCPRLLSWLFSYTSVYSPSVCSFFSVTQVLCFLVQDHTSLPYGQDFPFNLQLSLIFGSFFQFSTSAL